MTMTWPVVAVTLGIIAHLSFLIWLYGRHLITKSEHASQERAFSLQERAFALEEKKFDVWKTVQLAHTAQHGAEAKRLVQRSLGSLAVPPEMVPNGGKVVSMFERKKNDPTHAMIRAEDVEGEPTPERMQEIAEVLSKAKDLPEDEARALLAAHGIEAVQFFGGDDA